MGQTLQKSGELTHSCISYMQQEHNSVLEHPSAKISVTLWGKACTLIPKKHIVVLLNKGLALFPGDQHYNAGMLKTGDI